MNQMIDGQEHNPMRQNENEAADSCRLWMGFTDGVATPSVSA